MPLSELAGKTIGLYFGAYWSPPCCAFTVQLTDAYNNLKAAKGDCFEIVLISTDRDLEEFNVNKSTMPWLAVPYEDRTRHDLRRIFDVKGIPALVLIGPDGKVISVNGKLMVSSYGLNSSKFKNLTVCRLLRNIKTQILRFIRLTRFVPLFIALIYY